MSRGFWCSSPTENLQKARSNGPKPRPELQGQRLKRKPYLASADDMEEIQQQIQECMDAGWVEYKEGTVCIMSWALSRWTVCTLFALFNGLTVDGYRQEHCYLPQTSTMSPGEMCAMYTLCARCAPTPPRECINAYMQFRIYFHCRHGSPSRNASHEMFVGSENTRASTKEQTKKAPKGNVIHRVPYPQD